MESGEMYGNVRSRLHRFCLLLVGEEGRGASAFPDCCVIRVASTTLIRVANMNVDSAWYCRADPPSPEMAMARRWGD